MDTEHAPLPGLLLAGQRIQHMWWCFPLTVKFPLLQWLPLHRFHFIIIHLFLTRSSIQNLLCHMGSFIRAAGNTTQVMVAKWQPTVQQQKPSTHVTAPLYIHIISSLQTVSNIFLFQFSFILCLACLWIVYCSSPKDALRCQRQIVSI